MVDISNDTSQANLTLTFQSRAASYMQNCFGAFKAKQGTTTRAQFVKALVDRVQQELPANLRGPGKTTIKFICPDIDVTQPIALAGDQNAVTPATAAAQAAQLNKTGSIGAGARVTCKGVPLSTKPGPAGGASQLELANLAVSVGQAQKPPAPAEAIIACLYACMGESNLGTDVGVVSKTNSLGVSVRVVTEAFIGPWQGQPSVWFDASVPGGVDAEAMCTSFYQGGKGFNAGGAISRAIAGDPAWKIANEVEANQVWNDSHTDSYGHEWTGGLAQGIAEATAILHAAGAGPATNPSTPTTASFTSSFTPNFQSVTSTPTAATIQAVVPVTFDETKMLPKTSPGPLADSPHTGSSRPMPPSIIVLHDTEGGTTIDDIYDTLNQQQLSVHCVVTADGKKGRLVEDSISAKQVVAFNDIALGIEQCGFASQKDWPTAQIDATAEIVAHWASKYNIPLTFSTSHGVCQHKDLGAAGGGHDDCGPTYPFDTVLSKARALVTAAQSGSPSSPGGTPPLPVASAGTGSAGVTPTAPVIPPSDISQLQRGGPSNPDEDTWSCINRLASEVNWDFIIDPQPLPGHWGDYTYYISQTSLATHRPAAYLIGPSKNRVDASLDWDVATDDGRHKKFSFGVISNFNATIDNTAFAIQQGLSSTATKGAKRPRIVKTRSPQTPTQIQFSMIDAPFEFNSGLVLVLLDAGALNGRWIIESTSRATFANAFTEYTLQTPTSAWPEPRGAAATAAPVAAANPTAPGSTGTLQAAADAAQAGLKNKKNLRYEEIRPIQYDFLNPPYPKTLDCSGFVIACYKYAGLTDPSANSYNGQGFTGDMIPNCTKISKGDAVAGDMCFFGSSESATTHVNIYVGNGQSISHGHPGTPEIGPAESLGPSGFLGYYRSKTAPAQGSGSANLGPGKSTGTGSPGSSAQASGTAGLGPGTPTGNGFQGSIR